MCQTDKKRWFDKIFVGKSEDTVYTAKMFVNEFLFCDLHKKKDW